MNYDWLKEEKAPRVLVQAVKQLGKLHNLQAKERLN